MVSLDKEKKKFRNLFHLPQISQILFIYCVFEDGREIFLFHISSIKFTSGLIGNTFGVIEITFGVLHFSAEVKGEECRANRGRVPM